MQPGWSRTQIAGKPADVFEPPGGHPFVVVWLHDESGESPAASAAVTAQLQTHKLRCVAPLAGPTWWVDRVSPSFDAALTPERHLLDNLLPWAEATWGIGPRGVAVAGIGMGGQGAMRLAFRHPKRVAAAASACGTLDFHDQYGRGTPLDELYSSREYARQDTAVLHVDGHDWPANVWFACPPTDPRHRGNDRLHEKLAAVGVPHTADLDTPGTTDHLLASMFGFLADALARESRRLL
ncbi:Putative esterase OS=Blastopirellula marina DSM 3645 GN=DSM3645_08922 PE=4 SV=1: Esterase [Gemmataceae bacterium]|nr:Putative esterase OS=Blastopirellula marina DSM 3645 GN=DSM3645_08922 PE=4 SV=1: Esterase [Gemmataceae bacterium]VTT97156.1 Putative esterase OS=Blastopirellula marina DSM 3645 GN=DSM3645_08922 PE=4 SV=1: Esterase [Gemmataceae bacterium]